MNSKTLRGLRPWVQAVAFLVFLYLLVAAGRPSLLPPDLSFVFDPLAGLMGMLAARRILASLLAGSVVMLVLAVVLGRAWCGWLCPLGTLLDWVPSHRQRPNEPDLAPRWRQVKYFVLGLIVVAAVLGNLTFIVLDPITLMYRSGAVAAWPALNALITAIEGVMYALPPLRGLVDAFEAGLRGTVFPTYQPVYGLDVAAALLLAGILALNAVRSRFWCRYLCPLGGLLALPSRLALVHRTVGNRCVACQRCARACPTGTIDADRQYVSDPSECILCLECVPVCSRLDQHFTVSRPLAGPNAAPVASWKAYRPSRRQFLASAGTAVAAAGLLAAEPVAARPNPRLVRPPGAESDFTARCIRCGLCLKACPTSGLQPSLTVAGWGGLWTPVLVPRIGQCDYSCNACGQVCPTEAIPPLTLEDKRRAVIGHAYVDRSRCLPWADGRSCLVCEEMCPLPEKAIQLEEAETWTPDGPVVMKRPHVLHDRCIGCGVCENRCPLAGDAAIRVYAPTDLGTIGG